MKNLSKSKLIAYRQCPKRLWLEVHRKDLREDSSGARARFAVGHSVGELARRLYDPRGVGQLIDVQKEGYDSALERTRSLLQDTRPIFEAGFQGGGVLAFADILLKRERAGRVSWHAVEVKSSGKVHPYQQDDLAIQFFAMKEAGLIPGGLSIAHVDGKWTYPGGDDYRGLLKEVNLTADAKKKVPDIAQWVKGAARVAAQKKAPQVATGAQCFAPFECPFNQYCRNSEPKAKYPVTWLPRVQTKALKAHLADGEITDMRQVPDELLNEKQLRVKTQTLNNRPFFDVRAAAAALLKNQMPAYFLDFETVMFTVPLWAGTRPFQQIPFQFSVHVMQKNGTLTHEEFLDLTGSDPSRRFAEALIAACGTKGSIYVYSAGFEKSRIHDLAGCFPDLKSPLEALLDRIRDLRPIAESYYYHPAQQGSWSLKAVAPTIAAQLDYENLDGVADGGAAVEAYNEAISPITSATRKREIEEELRRYCGRDTEALVHFWRSVNR